MTGAPRSVISILWWLGHVIVNPLWLTSNITPILYASIVINGNRQSRTIHPIPTSALRS